MSRIFIYFLFVSIVIVSCKPKSTREVASSGSIEYKITYPQSIANQTISNILPEEMMLFFTPHELKFKIKGDLNIFSLEYLSRANGDSCFTLFKIVNRKLYYPLVKNEFWFLFDKNEPVIYKEYKDSIKVIAGYNCHKVMFAYSDNPDIYYQTYFTKDINLNKDLFNSPFKNIDGVPLMFEVSYKNMVYRFLATNISNEICNEKMFIPDDYVLTKPSEIHDLINSLLN